jgi:hypothetical protein
VSKFHTSVDSIFQSRSNDDRKRRLVQVYEVTNKLFITAMSCNYDFTLSSNDPVTHELPRIP